MFLTQGHRNGHLFVPIRGSFHLSYSLYWTTNPLEAGTVPAPSLCLPWLLEQVLDKEDLQGLNKHCLKFTEERKERKDERQHRK